MTHTRIARCAALGIVAALLGTAMLAEQATAKRKPKDGVFGVINGRKFKATNLNGADDPCVNGVYTVASGDVIFAALECKGKRRRQGTAIKIKKKMYKSLVMTCTNFNDVDVTTLPYELPCVLSIYGEWRTGRFGIPVGATQWGSSYDFGPPDVTSSVNMRVDAFDGTNVRGVITGTFDDLNLPPPVVGENFPPTAPAAIEGDLTFDFPFRVQ
jgi:hypothetical protein